MLYIACLHRNGLLKVGVTDRPNRRRAELRRKLGAPKLHYIIEEHVPPGWGFEVEWEKRLLAALRRRSCRLQLFSEVELSEEVVDASHADAHRELDRMLAETEVDRTCEPINFQTTRRIGGSAISLKKHTLKRNTRAVGEIS